jgi:hypothetical protein
MLTLNVNCTSCQWCGHLKDYQVFVDVFHYYTCYFLLLKDHLKQSHQQYNCLHCGEIFNNLLLLEEHKEKTCQKIPVNCILQKLGCKEQVGYVHNLIYYLVFRS